jgi:hypothetical protein
MLLLNHIESLHCGLLLKGRFMTTCDQFTDSLPDGLLGLGSGQIDAVNSSVQISGAGGQSCYVQIKNNSPHFSPITVRYYTVGEGGMQTDWCSTSYQIASFRTDVFKYAIFGDRISWNVEVALAADVDAALLLVNVFADPPQT